MGLFDVVGSKIVNDARATQAQKTNKSGGTPEGKGRTQTADAAGDLLSETGTWLKETIGSALGFSYPVLTKHVEEMGKRQAQNK